MSEVRESRLPLTIPLIVMAALLCPPTFGKIIYVDDDAISPGDGLSWQTAYKFVQDALADAQSADKPAEIRVAQGVYKPDRNALHPKGTGLRFPFELSGDVVLRGGYAGLISHEPNARDVLVYPSVLSGDLAENDVHVDNPRDLRNMRTLDDNSEGVVQILWPGSVLLEGFVITGGYVGYRGRIIERPYDLGGGGVRVAGNSATIRDCALRGNYSDWAGGGVAVLNTSDVRMERCVFVSNAAGEAGGGVWSSDSHVELSQCIFANNSAAAGGGLATHLRMFSGSIVSLSGSVISGNRVWEDGGALSAHGARVSVSNCVILGNSLLPQGAATIYAGSGAAVTVKNSILGWNRHVHFAARGALQVGVGDGATIAVSYCDVEGGWPGQGNIDADPLFADPGRWHLNGTPDDPNDDFFIEGDYHVKSQAGRWDPNSKSWVTDSVTSPCIDTGDPNSPVGEEPHPNGGRIDMGAYGGTAEASKSFTVIDNGYRGSGTAADPYLVFTAPRLREIAARPEEWNQHFRLRADIDLSGKAGEPFQVIGVDRDNPFSGVFDGDGHAISGVVLRSTTAGSVGLFGYVSGTVKNVGLIGPGVDGETGYHVGSLVGDNYGTVINCYAEDVNVAAGSWQAGGLVGYNKGTLTNCHSTGTVSGGNVGGLVGANRGMIEGSGSATAVSGDDKVGGLAADNTNGTITNCRSAGTTIGDDVTGGLVGDNSHGTIASCCSTGTVVGNDGVGGLVGQNWFGTITNCYSAADATGDRMTGGLVGDSGGAVTNCYATGQVSGSRWPIAGLVSFRHDDDTVTASFWDRETTTCSWSAGGVGKITVEMQTASTFLDAGWDFVGETKNGAEDIWWVSEGQDYPRLFWEAHNP